MADNAQQAREKILSGKKRVAVELEDLGVTVYAQSLPFSLAQRLVERVSTNGDQAMTGINEIVPELLVHGIVDGDGQRIFSEEDAEGAMDDAPWHAIQEMSMAVMELNGLLADEEAPAAGN